MKARNVILFALSAMVLVACGGNAKMAQNIDAGTQAKLASAKMEVREVHTSVEDVPDHFLAAVKGHLKSELRKRGLLAAEGSEANPIDVQVTYYRMRSGFTRMMFGIMAGKDGIEADVNILDAASGKVLTTMNASSYNITAMGNEDDIARMFAEEVAKALEENVKKSQSTAKMAH